MRSTIENCYCTAGDNSIVIEDFERRTDLPHSGKYSMFGILGYMARGIIPANMEMEKWGIGIHDLIFESMHEAAHEHLKCIVEGVFGSTILHMHPNEGRIRTAVFGLSEGVFNRIFAGTRFGSPSMVDLFNKKQHMVRPVVIRALAKCKTLQDVNKARIRLHDQLLDMGERYVLPLHLGNFEKHKKSVIRLAEKGKTIGSPQPRMYIGGHEITVPGGPRFHPY